MTDSDRRQGAPPSRPAEAGAGAGTLDRALELVRFLREHCPWDRAQTPSTLIPYVLEETHEVVDAIHDGDARALEGELGDLLLNVAFQVVLGEEEDRFDAASVVARLEEKMRRRHPHLFGLGEPEAWETLKARERREVGVLDGLARGLDPLTAAHRIQERVSGVGFDWSDYQGAFAKVVEELEEVKEALEERAARTSAADPGAAGPAAAGPAAADPSSADAVPADAASVDAASKDAASVDADAASVDAASVDAASVDAASVDAASVDAAAADPASAVEEAPPAADPTSAVEEELGDLLFAVVNLVRLAGAHPTPLLARANRKFRRRFERLEALAAERGIVLEDAGLEALDRLWDELKGESR